MSTHDGTMNHLGSEFRKQANNLGQDVKDLGSITKNMAGEAVGKLQENASEYYDEGVKQMGIFKKSLKRTVSEKPLVALLIAAGIGLIAGAIIKRR